MGETIQSLDSENMTRRGFLEFAGATVMGTALTVTGCSIPNPGRQEEKPIGVEQLREGEKLEEKFCNAVRAAAVTIFEYDDKLEKSIATATYLPETKSIYLAICNGKRDPDDQVVVRDFITMEIGVPSGALPDMGPEGLNDETIIRSLKGEQGEASAHSVLSLNILTGATGYETNWGVKYDEAKVRTVAYKENAMRYGDFDGGTIEAMTSKNLARVLADLNEGVDRLASV